MNIRTAITDFSTGFIKNFRVTILLIVSLLILGGFSYVSWLDREGFPSVDVPIVTVKTPYAVGDPQIVNQDVTRVLEEVLLGIDEVALLTSTTTSDVSVVNVEFNSDTTSAEGELLISQTLSSADLSPDIAYEVLTIDSEKVDGVHDLLFTINGEMALKELEQRADEIAVELEKSDAIVEANPVLSHSINVNPITGQESKVQDTFTRIGYLDTEGNATFSEAVTIGIIGSPELDSIGLSNAVKDEMSMLEEAGLQDGLSVRYGGDPAESLIALISSLEVNAISGLLAVALVLLFLVNWRSSIVVAIFIPLVLGGTFLALFLLGFTLNVISLFALILVLGLFVDDAIVIVEAIDAEVEKGKRGLAAIRGAVDSVGLADVSGSMTTILVFMPTLFIAGVLGDFIELIPITVIIALTLSLFVALAIIPLISLLFMGKERFRHAHTLSAITVLVLIILGSAFLTNADNPSLSLTVSLIGLVAVIAVASLIRRVTYRHKERPVDRILNATSSALMAPGEALRKLSLFFGNLTRSFYRSKKRGVIASVTILLVGASLVLGGLFAATKLEFAVFPLAKDSDEINITISTPPGSTIEDAESVAMQVEEIIADEVGDAFVGMHYISADKNSISSRVTLTEVGTRAVTSAEFSQNLTARFESEIPDANISAQQESPGPAIQEFPFAVQIFDESASTLEAAAADVEAALLDIVLENGTTISEVTLDDVSTITKKDGRTFTEVRAKTNGESDTGTLLAIQDALTEIYDDERLESLELASNALEFDFGSESDNLESFNSAITAFIFALLLMYVLLMIQFKSFSQPLLIFIAIPLSFPALFPGLLLTDNPLSFFTILGMIALSGIVVNNSIMLIDFANQARSQGATIIEAISDAVGKRLRPIITTSATTILGLFPLAISDPFWEPLALSIIFGVLSSALLIVLILPVCYVIIESIRDALKKRIKIDLSE